MPAEVRVSLLDSVQLLFFVESSLFRALCTAPGVLAWFEHATHITPLPWFVARHGDNGNDRGVSATAAEYCGAPTCQGPTASVFVLVY